MRGLRAAQSALVAAKEDANANGDALLEAMRAQTRFKEILAQNEKALEKFKKSLA